jgi:hypothetical protein
VIALSENRMKMQNTPSTTQYMRFSQNVLAWQNILYRGTEGVWQIQWAKTDRHNVIAQHYFLEVPQIWRVKLTGNHSITDRNKRENRDYVQQFDTKYETEDQTIRSDTTLNSENENWMQHWIF